MDRLFDISLGQGHELLRSLQVAGLSADQAIRLIKEPDTARRLVTTFFYPWSVSMPLWWRTPEEQIARARRTWGEDLEIPQIPANFSARTPTEVLLLHVPRSMKAMWDVIQAPADYAKNSGWDWMFSAKFNLLHRVPSHIDPVWVGFDPNFPLTRNEDLKKTPRYEVPLGCYLAASEVMSAAAQFTDWILTWKDHGPDMAGYSLHVPDRDYGKTSAVCLRTRTYPRNQLGFRVIPASLATNAALVRTL